MKSQAKLSDLIHGETFQFVDNAFGRPYGKKLTFCNHKSNKIKVVDNNNVEYNYFYVNEHGHLYACNDDCNVVRGLL